MSIILFIYLAAVFLCPLLAMGILGMALMDVLEMIKSKPKKKEDKEPLFV